ncbi:hypothetical protein VTN02DRAFT_5849 [Thermoascus thermophilus]
MSYAIETKKRKFNRVLDSLSKPLSGDARPKSSSALATTASELLSPSIKKVRMGGSGAEYDPLVVRPSAANASRQPSTPPTSRPNFVPWDRERFLERLETFRRVDRWSPKPAAINEVEWAKRGWSCTDIMRVTCVGGCGSSVVVKLPDEIDEFDGYDAEKLEERKQVLAKLVEEYSRLLAEGHSEHCPWRTKGCDATIHRLPLTNPEIAISALRKRYSSLSKMESKLPSRDTIETPEDFDVEAIVKMLPPEFFQPDEGSADVSELETRPESQETGRSTPALEDARQDINRAAFMLAFFGWDTVADGTAGLAGCGACFRRLGLWMYKPKENGEITVYNKLDVVNEHMDYCPWVNSITQSGSGKKTEKAEDLHSGWQTLVHTIRGKHRRLVRSTTSDHARDFDTRSVDQVTIDSQTHEARDKEWWAKLRRMRQVLNVKAPKKAQDA